MSCVCNYAWCTRAIFILQNLLPFLLLLLFVSFLHSRTYMWVSMFLDVFVCEVNALSPILVAFCCCCCVSFEAEKSKARKKKRKNSECFWVYTRKKEFSLTSLWNRWNFSTCHSLVISTDQSNVGSLQICDFVFRN